MGHEPMLGPFTTVQGTSKSKNLAFEKALLDRNPTRPALPSYEIQDEKIRRKPKLVTLPKERRFCRPKTEAELDREYEDKRFALQQQPLDEPSQLTWKSSVSSRSGYRKLESMSVSNLDSVTFLSVDETDQLPRKSKKAKFKISLSNEEKIRRTFDDSSYKKFKKPMPLDLNPAVISRLSRCHVFDSSLAKASLYKSNFVGSSVAETVKMHAGLDAY